MLGGGKGGETKTEGKRKEEGGRNYKGDAKEREEIMGDEKKRGGEVNGELNRERDEKFVKREKEKLGEEAEGKVRNEEREERKGKSRMKGKGE